MDLSRNNIEQMIIGELFLDTANEHIGQVREEWFLNEEFRLLLGLIRKNPTIRNDLVAFEFELKKEFFHKARYYYKILFKAVDMAIGVAMLGNHIQMLKEIHRNYKIEELYRGNKGEFTDEDIEYLHKLTQPEVNTNIQMPTLKDLSLQYPDLLDERKLIHADGQYQNATGFRHLDNQIGGIMPKNVVVIGGRTSMGKTALMTNIAVNLARNNRKVLYITCEMTEIELFDRIISALSGVEAYKLRYGRLDPNNYKQVLATLSNNDFYEKNLWLHYKPGITVAEIEERVNYFNPDILIVDHIQLIKNNKIDNQARAISEAMYRIAGLAGERSIGVVVGSQMNRESVKDGARGFEPVYYKGSGGIEESASVCCEIKMTDPKQKEDMNCVLWDIDFEVTKNRHGKTGRMKMVFDRQILQFKEVVDETPKQSTFASKQEIIRADWQ